MTLARSDFRSELRIGWLLLTAQGFHVGLAVAVGLNALLRAWTGEVSLPTFITTVPSTEVVACVAVVVLTTTFVDRWADFRRTSLRSPAATSAAIFVTTQLVCLLAVAGTGHPQLRLMPLVVCGASVAAVLSRVPRIVIWLPMLLLAYGWLRWSQYYHPTDSTLRTAASLLFLSSAAIYVGSATHASRR